VGEEKYGPLVLASQLLSIQQTRTPADLVESFFLGRWFPFSNSTINPDSKVIERFWLLGLQPTTNYNEQNERQLQRSMNPSHDKSPRCLQAA
jgi:hypothetical protein